MIMFKCLRGSAPAYLADYCTSTSLVPGRSALRSAAHGDIVVPSHRTDWGLRSFAVAGSSSWNVLPVSQRSSSFSLDTFAGPKPNSEQQGAPVTSKGHITDPHKSCYQIFTQAHNS